MVTDVVTRCADDRPAFWNETGARRGVCALCGEPRMVVGVIHLERIREMCRDCAYDCVNGRKLWPE
jgi:hypothetical protein